MLGDDGRIQAATDVKAGREAHEEGFGGLAQIAQDAVRDGLVEGAGPAEGPDVGLQGL